MYKFDLHIHSFYSKDSIIDPKKVIAVAKKKGMSGIAITDHNTIKGGIETAKNCEDDFFVIVGSEVATEQGDIIGLFLNEEIKSHNSFEVIDEIKDQDGLVVLPHPYRINNKIDPALLNKIDAIEVFNARTNSHKNDRAYALAEKHHYPMVVGSDAHFYGEIGKARIVLKDIASEENIKKQILSNETKNEKDLIFAGNIYYRALSVLIKKSAISKNVISKLQYLYYNRMAIFIYHAYLK